MEAFMKILLFVLLTLLYSSTVYTQQRVLLHINKNGQQEAIPIGKNENTREAIERMENSRPSFVPDTLRYYSSESELNTTFIFNTGDVALQWYISEVEGEVKEIWWKNETPVGTQQTAGIRTWRVNPKVLDLPVNAVNKKGRMGYYKTGCDCDWLVWPFRDIGQEPFYPGKESDSIRVGFDPLGKEAEWLPGGMGVTLAPNKWQCITLLNFGSPFYVKTGEVFGFTLQSTIFPWPKNEQMKLLSKEIKNVDSTFHYSPYHSIKFYVEPSQSDSTLGWQIRNYDWGMFVVIDYTTDGPWLQFKFLNLIIPPSPTLQNKISAIVKNVGGPAMPTKIQDVFLKYKIGYKPYFETVKMTANADTFSAFVPELQAGGTMFLYITALDSFGRRFQSGVASYSNTTSVKEHLELPKQFSLSQNYPNPFNPSTTIKYSLPASGVATIKIFDILGREIKTLVNEQRDAGEHSVTFNAFDLPSGIYFYQLRSGTSTATKKMLLLK